MSEYDESTFSLLMRAAACPENNTPEDAHSHRELWWEWLSLPLREQTSEIERALLPSGDSELFAMAEACRRASDGSLIPEMATPEERALFRSNFEMSIGLILGAAMSRQLGPDSAAAKGWLQPRMA